MSSRRSAPLSLGLAGAALGLGGALTARAYRRDLLRARQRISQGSQLAVTSRGPVEYLSVGDGFPLLVIHGAGGGFDQLLDLDAGGQFSSLGFRLIFVSRFGYLRTPLPSDPSVRAQADAYCGLLDALGIPAAAVLGVSAGAVSAVQFAAGYPSRCSALALLVPAAFVPGTPFAPPKLPPAVESLRDRLLSSDFAFWLATRLLRGPMIENILGTPLAAARRADAEDRQRIQDVLTGILPVSERRVGLLNDAEIVTHLESAGASTIRVPALIVSAEDDLFGTARSARYLASQIPGSRLVMLPGGGHLWIGHNQTVRDELTRFLEPFALRSLAVSLT